MTNDESEDARNPTAAAISSGRPIRPSRVGTPPPSFPAAPPAPAPAARAPAEPALRSAAWFAATGKLGFYHRSHTKSEAFPDDCFDGRPVIGVASSWSELAACNVHLHDLASSVKAGVWQAGGFPLEFPVMGLGETLLRPTAMLYRNLAAMEIEETLRANPLDGVVLLAGCDKTTPAMVMGATSVDLPTVLLTGGPMINGRFRGQTVGSGTDLWRFSEDIPAGLMAPEDLIAVAPGAVATASTEAALTVPSKRTE